MNLSENQILKGDGMNQTQIIFDLGGSGDAIRITGSIDNSYSPLITENAERR